MLLISLLGAPSEMRRRSIQAHTVDGVERSARFCQPPGPAPVERRSILVSQTHRTRDAATALVVWRRIPLPTSVKRAANVTVICRTRVPASSPAAHRRCSEADSIRQTIRLQVSPARRYRLRR